MDQFFELPPTNPSRSKGSTQQLRGCRLVVGPVTSRRTLAGVTRVSDTCPRPRTNGLSQDYLEPTTRADPGRHVSAVPRIREYLGPRS